MKKINIKHSQVLCMKHDKHFRFLIILLTIVTLLIFLGVWAAGVICVLFGIGVFDINLYDLSKLEAFLKAYINISNIDIYTMDLTLCGIIILTVGTFIVYLYYKFFKFILSIAYDLKILRNKALGIWQDIEN